MELREEKSEAQKRMAWIAMVSMIAFSVFLFLPLVSDSRVTALADLLGLFYIAQAGVVGAYMGATAWMSKK
jgi:ABC-type multidrug transport system permease subunit